MCHSVLADGKRTSLSPSGAGMMVIFGPRVWWWGIKREILVSVGHYLSSHWTAFLFSWFALWMSTFMSLCFKSMLSSTCSFLVINQKQQAKKKAKNRKRVKERLHEYNSFRIQVSHNNIFCLLQIGLELFYSSKCQKTNRTSKRGMWNLYICKHTQMCSGCEGTHFPPAHYEKIYSTMLSFQMSCW